MSEQRRALITGIGGQDGSYLAEGLLSRGWQVHGMHRRTSGGNLQNISHCVDKLTLHQGDICDPQSFTKVIDTVMPDAIFHMADQDNVDWSFSSVGYSMDITAKAVATLLEHLRSQERLGVRVFIPCSAMMFGTAVPPQNEDTRFNPQSPYACGKVAAFYLAEYYRRVHKMQITTGIMYNHDSPRRHGNYLLHRICRAAVRREHISLSSLDSTLSIGFAKTYMDVVQKLMIDPGYVASSFVIGTRHCHSLHYLVARAFDCVGLRWDNYVDVRATSERPGQQQILIPDTSKLKCVVPWEDPDDIEMIIHMLIEKYGRLQCV